MRFSEQIAAMKDAREGGHFPSAGGEGSKLVEYLCEEAAEELMEIALAGLRHGVNPKHTLTSFSLGIHAALWCVQQFGIPEDIAVLTGLPEVLAEVS